MINYQANCWPNREQNLLLQAGLLPVSQAQQCFQQYCREFDLQNTDHACAHVMPLVAANIPCQENYQTSWQICSNVHRYNWSKNHFYFFHLKKLIAALQSAGVEVCLLKGSALIAHYYQDAGLRAIGDIDILLKKDQVKIAKNVFEKLSYRAINPIDLTKLDQVHSADYAHPQGMKIDIHWSVFFAENVGTPLANFQFRSETVSPKFLKNPVQVLIAEDQLLHILVHGINYSNVPLIRWVADAVQILRKSDFDWRYFLAQTEKVQAMLIIKLSLLYLQDNKFINLPEKIAKKLQSYQATSVEESYYRLVTTKHSAFWFMVQWFWMNNLLKSKHKNRILAWLTLPTYLQNYWNVKTKRQLLIKLIPKLWSRTHAWFAMFLKAYSPR